MKKLLLILGFSVSVFSAPPSFIEEKTIYTRKVKVKGCDVVVTSDIPIEVLVDTDGDIIILNGKVTDENSKN